MILIRRLIQFIKRRNMNNEQYVEYLKNLGVSIGEGCVIDQSAIFGSEPWLISIGNNVRITKGVEMITHDGGLWTLRKMGLVNQKAVKYGSIRIGDNCNISWDVIIMPGVTIGKNSVIAAGAVVTKNVPEAEVWGGIPARKIETIEEYLYKVKDDIVPTFGMNDEDKYKYLKEHKSDLFER